jgi:hypothetical protein
MQFCRSVTPLSSGQVFPLISLPYETPNKHFVVTICEVCINVYELLFYISILYSCQLLMEMTS